MDEIIIKNQPDCILPKSFFEGRFIPKVHPESLDWEQWWDEQINRCLNGWSDGGYEIPGNYYYHLNMKKINMLNEFGKPSFDHPYFAFEDQQLFNDVGLARSQGKGLLLITGRGFGKSFGASSIVEHQFVFYEASECIISASNDFFATNLWSKIELGLNSLHPTIRPNFLRKKLDYRESGFQFKDDAGVESIVGYMSKMHKVVYDNDPGRTRGTRPDIHIFEEIGSWTGAASLTDCYGMTEASWWRGKHFTCFPFLIGTGGQMKQGASVAAKIMFHDPDAFNLLAFEYKGRRTCKFVPAYRKFEGFYERSGVSDEVGAKEFLDTRREKKKTNLKNFQQEIQEFPFEPEEAFMLTGGNSLPTDVMYDRLSIIVKTPELASVVQTGDLEWLDKSDIKKGVKWVQNKKGVFQIVEHPLYVDGRTPDNLYIGGCDSYDAAAENIQDNANRSGGAEYIYKRFWKPSVTGRMFVARLVERPDDPEEFYWNTVKLNMYYGCKMLYEHTKLGIVRHYITNKLTKYLYPKPDLVSLGVIKKTQTTNKFGVAMPIEVKRHVISKYGSYIKDNIDNMFFREQLEDGINFVFGSSKFDETMAAAIALLGDEDMYNVKIEEEKKESLVFPVYRRDAKGKLIFN
jgi:hypothetical protein